jgi:phytoene synthase
VVALPVFRARARTFWFAARFLPSDRRSAVAGLYTFARVVDDLVDERSTTSSPDPDATLSILGAWREWLEQPSTTDAPDPSVAAAALPVLVEHGVPAAYLHLLLDGVTSDLTRRDTPSWPELRAYCVQVASSVGLAMCHLLGAGHDPLARRSAVELGIAMQLTNILRDVGPDLQAGRVYLPSDELAEHGSSREHLVWLADRVARGRSQAVDARVRGLMRAQIARARAHYERGLSGVWRLPAESRLAILLAAHLYRAILDAIEAADYDVFSHRAATSTCFKLGQAIRWSVALRRPRWSRSGLAARAALEALALPPAKAGAPDDSLVVRS